MRRAPGAMRCGCACRARTPLTWGRWRSGSSGTARARSSRARRRTVGWRVATRAPGRDRRLPAGRPARPSRARSRSRPGRGAGTGGGRGRAVRRRRGGGAPGARGVGDAVLPVPAGRPRDGAARAAHGCGLQARGSRRGAPTPRAVQSAELPFWCWIANGGDGSVRRCLAAFAGSELARSRSRPRRGPRPVAEAPVGAEPRPHAVRHARAQAWALDPLAMGAYAAWDNRSWDRMEQFQRTVGRLAFAGEHTAGPEHHGTMEGASVRVSARRRRCRDARLTAPRSQPIRCSPAPRSGARRTATRGRAHGRRRRR